MGEAEARWGVLAQSTDRVGRGIGNLTHSTRSIWSTGRARSSGAAEEGNRDWLAHTRALAIAWAASRLWLARAGEATGP
jgi:hypothetical protein